MMEPGLKTSELIASLSGNLPPVIRYAVPMRLAAGIGTGAVVSALVMWRWLGLRPDLLHAAATGAFWMKFAYTLGLAVFAVWVTARLSRPATPAVWPAIGIPVVILLLGAMAAMQLMHVAPQARTPLVMGDSSNVCPWRIVALSLPVFAGTVWSVRGLAPTRLIFAGAVAGFASGAIGSWIYAFHCDESAAPFVLVFYTLGIAGVGALGAILARVALRW